MWLAEQQALDAIDDRLKADDPGLGSLFGIFTRLTGHEEMPTVERLDAAARRAGLPTGPGPPGSCRLRSPPCSASFSWCWPPVLMARAGQRRAASGPGH
jgi:hypothetical protein